MTEFPRTIGDVDLYLFNEGTHRRLWDVLGAHPPKLTEQDVSLIHELWLTLKDLIEAAQKAGN